jgi:regulator of sigma E protease
MHLYVTPRLFQEEGQQERWLLGIRFKHQHDVEYQVGLIEGLGQASREVWDMSYLTLNMFYRMATGQASLKHLSGPVTIAEYAGKTASISFEVFLGFLAIVSISLGIINLLPIPLLDGGHLMYYAIEAIKGSPVSEEAMLLGQKIGIIVLLFIMSIAISNDIQRILN